MKITTEDFITSFYSLDGITIGERQKQFCLLLNSIRESEPTDLDFSLVQPRNALEEKLKVDALIYFKRIPEILEIFKSENLILIERVLKISPWLIDNAFNDISGSELVNTIFPHISFNAKIKLLNKIGLNLKNSHKGDEYFKCVEEKYGFYLASRLLPCCGIDTVIKCIKAYKLKLMPKHLLLIIKKEPTITEQILKELKNTRKINLASEYANVFQYIAKHDIELFLKLNKDYKVSIKLGWRTTDKYVKRNKIVVIKDPDTYYKFLHNKQIAKSLNQNFPELYSNMFPSLIKNFPRHYQKLINMCNELPTRICNVELLLTTFQKVYGSNLWDHPTFINLNLINILTPQLREVIVKIEKRPEQIDEAKWYSYMKIDISIPYLKKTITLSSNIKSRTELVSLLVETCKINDDKAALRKLCEYMVNKHRNDHISVRLAFLSAIRKNFKLYELGEEHWTPINELIEIFTLNDENFYHASDFIVGYVHFCLKNNKDVREELKKYLKVNTYEYNIIKEVPEYEKKCLLIFGELLPDVCDDEESLENNAMTFLRAVVEWNGRHPEDQISLFDFPNYMEKVVDILKRNQFVYQVTGIIDFLIYKVKPEIPERNEILRYYFSEDITDINRMAIVFLLKKEPLLIKSVIINLTKSLLKMHPNNSYSIFLQTCRYFTHLDIPQGIIETCKIYPDEDIDKYSKTYVIENSILGLSYLMSDSEFCKFIEPYKPTEIKADSKTDEGKKIFAIQLPIGKCLRNIKPASSALNPVLMFCKGDYLKLIQGSLYSICGNINENKLLPFFNELSTRAVSVRKHALHLSQRVLDKEHVFIVLKKFMETEKNPSVRKFIFKSIFNFFVQSPSDYSWEMFQNNMKAVDLDDKEAVEILMQTEKIPRSYFIKYLIFTWNIIAEGPGPQSEKETNFSKLLRNIELQEINLLPEEFSQNIIDTYFMKHLTGLTSFQSIVNSFVCKFIIYCDSEDEQDSRLNINLEVLVKCLAAKPEDLEKRAVLWNYASDFLKEFCLPYLHDKSDNVRIFNIFCDIWKKEFPAHKAIKEYLHLDFTLIYIDKLPLSEIGKRLAMLCNELAQNYGNIIVPIFSKKIKFFYKYFLNDADTKEKIALILSILESDLSIACVILAILLLDYNWIYDEDIKPQYQQIIDILEKQTDPTIQIYYYNYARDKTTLDY